MGVAPASLSYLTLYCSGTILAGCYPAPNSKGTGGFSTLCMASTSEGGVSVTSPGASLTTYQAKALILAIPTPSYLFIPK